MIHELKSVKFLLSSALLCIVLVGKAGAIGGDSPDMTIPADADKETVAAKDVSIGALTEDKKIESVEKEKNPSKPKDQFFPYGDEERKEAPTKTKVELRHGDFKLTFGGTTKIETWFTKNIFLLNNRIPDEYEFFKQTMDLTLNIVYGEKRFGYPALEFFVDLRQKALWGSPGRYVETVNEIVKVDDSIVSRHKHMSDKALIWLRGLWLKMTLDALFDKKPNSYPSHYLKFGFFPFELGRGISLGTIYGAGKDFLGIYTGYQNDTYAPGILLHGDLVKDKLSYDVYYSKLEEKGDSIVATFNLDKAALVGRALNPWRGVGKDNDLFAGRISYTPIDDDAKGTLELEAYGFYNAASDRKIEIDFDSNIKLGTIGLATEYYYKDLEFGGEIAMNLGKEIARAIDRNIVKVVRDPNTGVLFEQYSHLLDANNQKAPVTDANKALLKNNKLQNKITDNGLAPLHSAANRFRKDFTVEYKGWMGVFDASYKFKRQDLKFAAGLGYASGDKNPFRPDPTTSGEVRKYRGWIGLQEQYVGKRVISMFVLDARKLKRPMSVSIDNETEAGDDNSFTDIFYTGVGFSWFPREHNEDKFCINPNLLFYWKVHKAHKFDRFAIPPAFSKEHASKFLGTEFNILAKYEIYKYMQLFANMAVFLPGTFYKDVKGLPLRDDIFKRLDLPNNTSLNILGDNNLDPSDYRLSNNVAFMLNVGVVFRF